MRLRTVKPIAALALTGVGTALVIGFRTTEPGLASVTGDTSVAPPGAIALGPTPTTRTGTADRPTRTTPTQPAATTRPASRQAYADGTWVGDPVGEPWGTFQVAAVIAGGKLVDVQYAGPDDRHSNRINRQAVPMLTQEAISAQGTDIDLLGGATWTSESYVDSLQSALDSARAAASASS